MARVMIPASVTLTGSLLLAASQMARGSSNATSSSAAVLNEQAPNVTGVEAEPTASPNTTTTTSTTTTRFTSTTSTFTLPFSNCTFDDTPVTPWAWDPTCTLGKTGCNADDVHLECKFCGAEPYDPCPACVFLNEPLVPVVWDNKCEPEKYTRGCFADGISFECRFCGIEYGFDPCPSTTSTSTTVTSISAGQGFLQGRDYDKSYHHDSKGETGKVQLWEETFSESSSADSIWLRSHVYLVYLALFAWMPGAPVR